MEPLVALTRINRIESMHTGFICVADSLDKTILSIGDPNTRLYLRSSGKPFIAVALVNSGALEAFHISLPELAVICSSHAGEDYHLEAIRSILKKAGIDESCLDCGAHITNQNKKIPDPKGGTSAPHSQLLFGQARGASAFMPVLRFSD